MKLESGMQAGNYLIERLLGKGGMGQVYLAQDLTLKRQVALKMLSVDQLSPDAQVRWRNEMKIMAKLNHPNIVSIHHVILEEDGRALIVMEYLPRGSLRSELARLAYRAMLMPIPQVLETGIQVGEALDFVHKQGIIHRDVKPDNILIAEVGSKLIYKLGDFGIAIARDLTRVTETGGRTPLSPDWASPEQYLGQFIDHRSDIYSLGATLWSCIVHPRATLSRTPQNASLPLPKISDYRPEDTLPSLQDVIARATSPHPDDRFQSAAEFVEALKVVQQEYWRLASRNVYQAVPPAAASPMPPKVASISSVPSRRPRTSPALLIAGLLVTVCLLGLLVAVWGTVAGVLDRASASDPSAAPEPAVTVPEPLAGAVATRPASRTSAATTSTRNTPEPVQVSNPLLTPKAPVVRVHPEATSTAIAAATASARQKMAEANLRRILRATDTQLWILGTLNYQERLFRFDGQDLFLLPASLSELRDIKGGTMDSKGTFWILTAGDVHRLVGNEWARAVDVRATFGSRRYEFDHIGHLHDDTIFVIGRWAEQNEWYLQRSFVLFGKDETWEVEFFDLREAYVEFVVSPTELWLVDGNGRALHFARGQIKNIIKCGSRIRRFTPLPGSESDAYTVVDSFSDKIWRVKQGACERVVFSEDLTRGFSPWTIRIPSSDIIWFFSRDGELLAYEQGEWRRRKLFQSYELNHVYLVSERSAWLVGNNGLIMSYKDGAWSMQFGK